MNPNDRSKDPLGRLLVVLFLYLVIGFAWAGAEMLVYGETRPDSIDSIVGIILAIAIEPYLTKTKVIGVAKFNGYYFDVTGYNPNKNLIRITMGRQALWIPVHECEEIDIPQG